MKRESIEWFSLSVVYGMLGSCREGGGAPVAFENDFVEVAGLQRVEPPESEVVEDEHVAGLHERSALLGSRGTWLSRARSAPAIRAVFRRGRLLSEQGLAAEPKLCAAVEVGERL